MIHRALIARESYKAGERSAGKLTEIVRQLSQSCARLDYVSVADAETLEKLDKLTSNRS